MCPDLGTVSEGQCKAHTARGDIDTGIGVGQSNMGDLRVFSQEGLVCGELGSLTRGRVLIC